MFSKSVHIFRKWSIVIDVCCSLQLHTVGYFRCGIDYRA